MDLTESVQALEAKNITVAINLGTHQHCAIDSNCPLAVELRRIITDAGITLTELVEGFVEATAPDPANYELPELSSKVTIKIAGKTMEFELDDVVSGAMKTAIDERFRAVDVRLRDVRRLGNGLYTSYLGAIAQARKTKTLPQLRFSKQELMKANCHVTCNSDSYIFLFPTEYKPEYMVRYREGSGRDNLRYKLADEDIEAIKEPAWLELTVRGNRFLKAMILNREAKGIVHYHGNRDSACWGHVKIPASWDGTLKSLVGLKTLIMGSLATINANSLLNHHPPGKPHSDELIDGSTEMGREGTVAPTPPPAEPTVTPQPRDTEGRFAARDRTRWGTTRAREAAATLTDAQEYHRRWGVGSDDDAADLEDGEDECAVCGEDYGMHDGYTCPRDQRR